MNVIATREEFLRDAISAHDRVKTFTRRREEKLIVRKTDECGRRAACCAVVPRLRDGGGSAPFSFSVVAVYDHRIISLSEISSDGHRPPLRKNAKNHLQIFARSLACDLHRAR